MSDYGNLMGRACAGFLVDSSDYNIDGTCYVSPGQLNLHPGRIVHVDKLHDGIYKEISAMFHPDLNESAYGVVLRNGMSASRYVDGSPVYSPLETVSVVTHGRVWVPTETLYEAPKQGTPVHSTIHGLATSEDALEIPGWTFTGDFYRLNGEYALVGVQVLQSHGHIDNEFKIKVNGIHLTVSHQNPIKVNTPVTVSAEVSPPNATDKTGSWHLDSPQSGTIEKIGDGSSILFRPTQSLIDDVHITWVANDGSDVRGMVELTYVP